MNPILVIALFIIEAVLGGWYIVSGFPNVTKTALSVKIAAGVVFIVNGYFAYLTVGKTAYGFVIVLALIFGLIGDAFLSFEPLFRDEDATKKNKIIICTVIGAAFFLIGHLLYMYAYGQEIRKVEGGHLGFFLIIWAVTITTAIIIKFAIKLKMGKFAFPILAYALTLSAMFALAVTLSVLDFKGQFLKQAVLICAALCFVVSDSSLAMRFFDKKYHTLKHRTLTLTTYYAAQMLFGLSVYLIK